MDIFILLLSYTCILKNVKREARNTYLISLWRGRNYNNPTKSGADWFRMPRGMIRQIIIVENVIFIKYCWRNVTSELFVQFECCAHFSYVCESTTHITVIKLAIVAVFHEVIFIIQLVIWKCTKPTICPLCLQLGRYIKKPVKRSAFLFNLLVAIIAYSTDNKPLKIAILRLRFISLGLSVP